MKHICSVLAGILIAGLYVAVADGEEHAISDAASTLVNGNNQFALELYQDLAATTGGNVFISPWSISSAFGMAWAGARGPTAEDMAAVLHFPPGQETTHPLFGEVHDALNAIQEEGYLVLDTANAMWPAVGWDVLPAYAEILESYYHAHAESLDYVHDTEGSRLRINEWVAENTMERIPELVVAGVLSPDVVLVLTNAVYFKGAWQTLFDPDDTVDDVFHRSNGDQLAVDMMQLREELPVYEDDDLLLVTLPYHGEQMEAVLMSSKDGDLTSLEAQLTHENLNFWLTSRTEQESIVRLPRFSLRFKVDLVDALERLGMLLPFSGAADFSGIFGSAGIAITKVIHETFLQVKEEGTEAAGATAIVIERTSVDPIPVFNGNRPFLFLIRDTVTGSLLFMGRIDEPLPVEDNPAEVDPQTIKDFFGESAHLEDRWWQDTSIGRFKTDKWPWLQHAYLGWLYIDVATASTDGF